MGTADSESTIELLERSRGGDADALELLFERLLPALKRWARGRLPRFARVGMDTEDLVMDTATNVLKQVGSFEPRHSGALQAYLRQAVTAEIRERVRKAQGTRHTGEDPNALVSPVPSPLEQAIGIEALERYESALARLPAEDRDLIVCRIELQYSYAELAALSGAPSPDAARMRVARALSRLTREM